MSLLILFHGSVGAATVIVTGRFGSQASHGYANQATGVDFGTAPGHGYANDADQSTYTSDPSGPFESEPN